jgi:hypothetical protein
MGTLLPTPHTQVHPQEANISTLQSPKSTAEKITRITSSSANTTSPSPNMQAYMSPFAVIGELQGQVSHLESLYNKQIGHMSQLKTLHHNLCGKVKSQLYINFIHEEELHSLKLALSVSEEGVRRMVDEREELEVKCDELERKNIDLMFQKAGMEEEIERLQMRVKTLEVLYGDDDEIEA